MPRKNYNPKNFELDVDHPWTMAIHSNDIVVLNPQLDLEHPGDLETQTTVSIGHIRKLLGDIDCAVSDITNLRVSYVNNGDVDEDSYRQSILTQLPDLDGATLEMVPFDRLVLPELLVEICSYAMRGQDGGTLSKGRADPKGLHHPGAPLSQGVTCGNMIYVGEQAAREPSGDVVKPNDLPGQCAMVLDQLQSVLHELDADLADVVRLNVFYDLLAGDDCWAACLELMSQRFGDAGPCLTAIPLPRLYPEGKMISLSAWAMRGQDGVPLDKRRAIHDSATQWCDALACGDMIFTGGISTVNADGTVDADGDHIAQTKKVMQKIDTLMRELGGQLQHVHKTNSFYVLSTVEEFNSNLQVRSDCFEKPGPGSVGLPLDRLTHPGQRIEVEAMLVKT